MLITFAKDDIDQITDPKMLECESTLRLWSIVWMARLAAASLLGAAKSTCQLSSPRRWALAAGPIIATQRSLQVFGVLWFCWGGVLTFTEPHCNCHAFQWARGLWWFQACAFAVPCVLHLLLFLCLPCLVFVVIRALLGSDQKPTPDEIISTLESTPFAQISAAAALQGVTVPTTCSICMTDFVDEDAAIVLPCDRRHFFHTSCVTPWLKNSQLCPLCRANVVDLLAEPAGTA
eukprot:Polyplicarium_translucidae@DN3327_c0_g2_i1.p3